MINVLADKYIYKIDNFLTDEVNLTFFDPQQPFNIPDGTDALLVRTTVKINSKTLSRLPSSLKFVATASSGIDHVDTSWLRSQRIAFADAAGCNARAVAEYVATSIVIWADENKIQLENSSVGIIGVGNAGGETLKLLDKAGLNTVAYDPLRTEREEAFQSASLDEVLRCNVLTFHTPLTFQGKYPTYHWLDEKKLINDYSLIINAARGGIVDEKCLLNSYKNQKVGDYILDVWKNEPVFSSEVAKNAFIHTPHVAGYSVQAKRRASKMVAYALCDYFDLKRPNVQPAESKKKVEVSNSINSLSELLCFLHPLDDYHRKFSKLIGKPKAEKGSGFYSLRTKHPLRHEYRSLELLTKSKEYISSFEKVFK